METKVAVWRRKNLACESGAGEIVYLLFSIVDPFDTLGVARDRSAHFDKLSAGRTGLQLRCARTGRQSTNDGGNIK